MTANAVRDRCYKDRCQDLVVAYVVMIRGPKGMELPVCKKHADQARRQGRTVRRVEDSGGL